VVVEKTRLINNTRIAKHNRATSKLDVFFVEITVIWIKEYYQSKRIQ